MKKGSEEIKDNDIFHHPDNSTSNALDDVDHLIDGN